MKNSTIKFTPESTLKEGFYSINNGVKLVFFSIVKIIDRTIHKHPYPFMMGVIFISLSISILYIMDVRAERDAALKKQYKLQQNIEQLEVALSTKQ